MVISIDPHGAASRQPGRLQQKRRPPPGIYQCWKVTQYSTATTTATTTNNDSYNNYNNNDNNETQ